MFEVQTFHPQNYVISYFRINLSIFINVEEPNRVAIRVAQTHSNATFLERVINAFVNFRGK